MIVVGVTWRLAVFSTSTSAIDSAYFIQQLPGMADLFGVGLLLALVARRGTLKRALVSPWARVSLLVISLAYVAVMIMTYHSNKPTYWSDEIMVVLWPLAFAVGIAGVVASLSTPASKVHGFARLSGLTFLGTVSFGIYLFHPLVIETLNDHWIAGATNVSALPFILAVLAGTVIVATLLHYTVERPAMVFGRRLAGRSARGPGIPRQSADHRAEVASVVAPSVPARSTGVSATSEGPSTR
jgi:peptidoglycan/LPS O-acetylase OafA/YrhL